MTTKADYSKHLAKTLNKRIDPVTDRLCSINLEDWMYAIHTRSDVIHRPDGSLDVYNGIDISTMNLREIPVKFNCVYGEFNCSNNYLTSLHNAPRWVFSDCNVWNNEIESLEGGPEIVHGIFNCSGNKLTSLKGCPRMVEESFVCTNNPLIDIHEIFRVKMKRMIIDTPPNRSSPIWRDYALYNRLQKL